MGPFLEAGKSEAVRPENLATIEDEKEVQERNEVIDAATGKQGKDKSKSKKVSIRGGSV